jgi:hypothetical protein
MTSPSLIPDSSTDGRMAGLETFLQRYLGPRHSHFGEPAEVLATLALPAPLRRFFAFAGRWPFGDAASDADHANRFCVQDELCAVRPTKFTMPLKSLDGRVVFVCENQGVWVAATEPAGEDPPVWISEDCSHRDPVQTWRQLENPLSHFLVSFVLQETVFSSGLVAVAPDALPIFQAACLTVEPVWLRGEYAWDIDRPSYFLIDNRFLLRHAPDEGSGDDWYAANDPSARATLDSLGLPVRIT